MCAVHAANFARYGAFESPPPQCRECGVDLAKGRGRQPVRCEECRVISRRKENSACGKRRNAARRVLAHCVVCGIQIDRAGKRLRCETHRGQKLIRCLGCGEDKVVHCGNKMFCSRECDRKVKAAPPLTEEQERRQTARRHIRRQLPSIWRNGDCGICRRPVDKSNRWPHPMSPTVDHIIPVREGGGDGLDNLQLAHMRCNQSKCAKILPGQLHLPVAV